jgi:RimJ/RimL family protein N-acetyltransferase
MTPVELTAGFFTLRAPEPVDTAWIFHACQDPQIARWTRSPSPYRPLDAVAFVMSAMDGWANNTNYRFVIVVTDTGELLGACALTRGRDDVGGDADATGAADSADAELGFWLAVDGRTRGAATAAVNALMQWAPSVGVARVWAVVKHGNVGSEAVLQRCGFALVDAASRCVSGDTVVPANRWERAAGEPHV